MEMTINTFNEEPIENIKLNEKYTLILENTVGFIVSRQMKIVKVQKTGGSLILYYVLKGKRKINGMKYAKEQRLAIIEGWKDIKGTITDKNEHTFISFEENRFNEVIKLNEVTPIYLQ